MSRRAGYVALFLLLVVAHILTFGRLEEVRVHGAPSARLEQIKPVMPPALACLSAGEFKGLIADFMTLEAASALGKYLTLPGVRIQDLPDQAWDVIYELFETSQILDPYFSDNYRLVQPFFAWMANRPEQAISFLKKGVKVRTWDWELAFFIGFDYFYFLEDNLLASHYFQEAYSRPGGAGSITLATFSAKLLQKAGKTELAISYLSGLLEKETNEMQIRAFSMRLKDLQGTLLVEKAVANYKQKFGTFPENVGDLIRAGILTASPEKSVKQIPFCINQNGNVFYDQPDCREPKSEKSARKRRY